MTIECAGVAVDKMQWVKPATDLRGVSNICALDNGNNPQGDMVVIERGFQFPPIVLKGPGINDDPICQKAGIKWSETPTLR